MRAGDFVWSMFPFDDAPESPGPARHVALVVAVASPNALMRSALGGRATDIVVCLYTTSRIGRFEAELPVGVVPVSLELARRHDQQVPFLIDTRRRAFLPPTSNFFPDIGAANGGVIASIEAQLFSRVKEAMKRVNDRHRHHITNAGPLRPRGT